MRLTMQSLVVSLALLTTADALTCLVQGTDADTGEAWDSTCVGDLPCYISKPGQTSVAGCLPAKQLKNMLDDASGCTDYGCHCSTNDCNTADWVATFATTWVRPPTCWSGVIGANIGPSCDKSALYTLKEFKEPEGADACSFRTVRNQCVENNKWIGMGDGCGDKAAKAACEATTSENSRDLSDSFDGTSQHCRWIPDAPKDDALKAKCEKGDACQWHPEQGCSQEYKDKNNGVCAGECSKSASTETNKSNWETERGLDCEKRLQFGCFENTESNGESEDCTKNTDSSTCLAANHSCSQGTCSGQDSACAGRRDQGSCTGGTQGCTWASQCCKWLPKPTSMMESCKTPASPIAGSLAGVCEYSDGVGPPQKAFIGECFKRKIFINNLQLFSSKCAIVASFRNGSGAATVLGSDKADLLGKACNNTGYWEALAEHIGHTKSTIKEYCTNFIPDASAMGALKAHAPSFVIAKAEEGQFDALLPGLAHLMFVVTAKPAFGKCLFTADYGKFGTGICTCDEKECNNKTALELIVDKEKGPMRLLQFIDGTMASMKTEINKAVPDLLDANGKLNMATVGLWLDVASSEVEKKVVSIMAVAGMSSRTNKDELLGIIQDYIKLLKSERTYKTAVMAIPALAALKIDASKVAAANQAATMSIYGSDGTPLTLSLQALSTSQVKAVATSTGIAEAKFTAGVTQAHNKEHGITTQTSGDGTTGGTAVAKIITSTGTVSMKMSKAHATALVAKPEAKTAFASAVAKTTGLDASAITITAIYVDGVKVNSTRRLSTEATVTFDWEAKATKAISTAEMNTATLQTQIVAEVKTVAGIDVVITAAPSVTVVPQPVMNQGAASAASGLCLAGFTLFACFILGALL